MSPEHVRPRDLCYACKTPLVKDGYVELPDGRVRVFTHEERAAHETMIASFKQTLECQACGGMCWRRNVPHDHDGYGLCRRCGGRDTINRPAEILPLYDCRYNDHQMWLCPNGHPW